MSATSEEKNPKQVFILSKAYQFNKWKKVMINCCTLDDTLAVLNGSDEPSASASAAVKKKYKLDKVKVLNRILLNISDEYASRISYFRDLSAVNLLNF